MRPSGRRALPAVLALAILASFLAPCLCAAAMPQTSEGHCGGTSDRGLTMGAGGAPCACPCMSTSAPTTANLDVSRSASREPCAAKTFLAHERAVLERLGNRSLPSPAPPGPPPPLVQRV